MMLKYSDCRIEGNFCDVGDRVVLVDKRSVVLLSAVATLLPAAILPSGSSLDNWDKA